MILKSLTMHGFKSFPDKTVLEFDKGITAVVGPNGSGKSNISDAVRWVLGEQSTKSLRGSRMEDVIFGGTEKRKKMGYAEASLVFDNSSGDVPLESKEITVSRRYYRSGESEYRINGEISRLKDVNELFMDTGLGRDGYSIISQGRISDIISSRGSERRDIFDEASGISRFKYRRADATRKLQQAEENLVRLRDILSELEMRVGPLKEQAEKAEKFIVLAGEKKELEIGLWLFTLQKYKDELTTQERKLSAVSSQYESAQDELAGIGERIEKLIELSREKTLRIEEIRGDISKTEDEARDKTGEAAIIRNTILHNNETIERIMREVESADDLRKLSEKELAGKNAEIDEINAQIDEISKGLLSLKDEMTKALSGDDSLGKKMSALAEKTAGDTAALQEKKIEISTCEASLLENDERIKSIEESFSDKEQTLKTLSEQKRKSEKEIEENSKYINEMSNSLSGYERLLRTKSEKLDALASKFDSMTLSAEQLRHKAENLESLEKNMEGYFGSVKKVIASSKRGILSGIHGAVSMLIKTEPKYEAAIETALGGAMQYIVTDTENDAKRAINHLRNENAGRSTFLPLSTIRGKQFNDSKLKGASGYVGIASDLVSCDPKYSEIIKFLLGKTAVCETMDDALSLAKSSGYSTRIVTLDGQVVNVGGSMTGGSRNKNAGILSRSSEIERLKKQRSEIIEKSEELKKDIKELSEETAKLKAQSEGLSADLLRAQEEGMRLASENAIITEKLRDCEESANNLTGQLDLLNERKNELSKRLKNATALHESLTNSLQKCEEEMAAFNRERESFLQKKDEISEKMNALNVKSAEKQKELEALVREGEAIKERMLASSGRQDTIRAEVAEIEKKNDGLLKEAEEADSCAALLQEKAQLMKAEIDKIIEERMSVEAESEKLRSSEREVSLEKERLGNELARLSERKQSMENQYDEIVAQLYDEYALTKSEAQEIGIEIEDERKAKSRLSELKGKIKALGNVNVGAVEEYKEVNERYVFMSGQVSDVEKSKSELTKIINELTESMKARFSEQFKKINENFGKCFTELFSGGSAELSLSDESDILSCDIEIKVQPPGKNVQNIDLFSGGEKVLSAIALLFSILKVTPAPFCIFDEVEAALDDVNVDKYADYMRKMTEGIQFIAITHRRGTMEEADVLYGVTMQEKGVSKLLKLNAGEIAQKLGLS